MAEDGMEETKVSSYNNKIEREAPQLVTVLKHIKGGVDDLRAKVQLLTLKSDDYPTSDGISYLEAKHLLLLSYCQSLVYYLLHKAKGLPIQGHPLVQTLLETRLFLEKVCPVDKKLQYQIQKLTRLTGNSLDGVVSDDKKPHKGDDSLKLRPNPGMLIDKVAPDDNDGKYRPPKIAPASMDESKTSKQERNVSRKEKQAFREALQSEYARDLMNELEGRPEEVREVIGIEDRDVTKYKAKMEERARGEEENFTRAPLTCTEKKKQKHLLESRNGGLGLGDKLCCEIKFLHPEDGDGDGRRALSFMGSDGGERKFKRRKFQLSLLLSRAIPVA
ncbi:hypothetical protein L1987_10163 [Smallanthus sonchifolius]|uniref:Uncharacterized protein n=1 Tax=Smallanthus sonchifolius TaxID=185202 RepID=A0ACB9JRB6_9ASTR|nr:hypothetical protein L1987_10163 [Smallanthus sonchifolius]